MHLQRTHACAQSWHAQRCRRALATCLHLPEPCFMWHLLQAPQYIEWCTGVAPSNDSSSFNDIDMTPFWSNPQCQQLYKNHVRKVLNR